MTTLPIVKHFDVFEDLLGGFLPREVTPVMDELFLERAEEALDTGVDAPMSSDECRLL